MLTRYCRKIGEWGAQQKARWWMGILEPGDNTRTDRFTKVDDIFCLKTPVYKRIESSNGIICQALFRRAAGVPAISAVIHKQHRETRIGQQLRNSDSARTVSTVSRCIKQPNLAVYRSFGRNQPGGQFQAVGSRECYVLPVIKSLQSRTRICLVRQEHERSLKHPNQRQESPQNKHEDSRNFNYRVHTFTLDD